MYIATDNLTSVDEFAACKMTRSLDWKLWSASDNPARGMNGSVTYRLWADILLLVGADWVVGTFSSNIGRLVQVLRTQEESTFVSVDEPAARGWFPR